MSDDQGTNYVTFTAGTGTTKHIPRHLFDKWSVAKIEEEKDDMIKEYGIDAIELATMVINQDSIYEHTPNLQQWYQCWRCVTKYSPNTWTDAHFVHVLMLYDSNKLSAFLGTSTNIVKVFREWVAKVNNCVSVQPIHMPCNNARQLNVAALMQQGHYRYLADHINRIFEPDQQQNWKLKDLQIFMQMINLHLAWPYLRDWLLYFINGGGIHAPCESTLWNKLIECAEFYNQNSHFTKPYPSRITIGLLINNSIQNGMEIIKTVDYHTPDELISLLKNLLTFEKPHQEQNDIVLNMLDRLDGQLISDFFREWFQALYNENTLEERQVSKLKDILKRKLNLFQLNDILREHKCVGQWLPSSHVCKQYNFGDILKFI